MHLFDGNGEVGRQARLHDIAKRPGREGSLSNTDIRQLTPQTRTEDSRRWRPSERSNEFWSYDILTVLRKIELRSESYLNYVYNPFGG